MPRKNRENPPLSRREEGGDRFLGGTLAGGEIHV